MIKRAILPAALVCCSCLGSVTNLRSYYVLAGDPADPPPTPIIRGLVRVRNMDSDQTYEKFQIVVRKSPYELRYSDLNVWAVKPNEMVSDIVAKTLLDTGTFSGVTRGLGDLKPDYTLSGELHALEIYDSDDVWFAHLSVSLRLNRFDTGDRIWSFSYEQRKPVETKTFSHAVRALSELLSAATRQAITELIDLQLLRGGGGGAVHAPPSPEPEPDKGQTLDPIYVPEEKREP